MENKIYGYIYLITNLINGKQYVGKTTRTIKKRFSGHCSDAKIEENSCMIIVRSIKKYGKENFKIEEIGVAYSKTELKLLEGFYINKYNTLSPNGYNLTSIINGYDKHSEETKEKIRIKANTPERLKWASENGIKSRGKKLGGTSKYVGVYYKNNRYIAKINHNNKRIHIGQYYYEDEAAKAYDIKAIKYYGNNTNLNFPELREYYISEKIIINKSTKNDNSKSGIKNIHFHKNGNKWKVKYFDKTLNKKRFKFFNILQEAIIFNQLKQNQFQE